MHFIVNSSNASVSTPCSQSPSSHTNWQGRQIRLPPIKEDFKAGCHMDPIQMTACFFLYTLVTLTTIGVAIYLAKVGTISVLTASAISLSPFILAAAVIGISMLLVP